MIPVGTIFDTYININILLLVGFAMWAVSRLLMRPFGINRAYNLQLQLIKSLLLALFIAPVLVTLFDHFIRANWTGNYTSLSITDLVVAQYLQGSFDVKAAELETFLSLRGRLTDEFLGIQSSPALFLLLILGIGAAISAIRLGLSVFRLQTIINKSFAWRRFGNLHLLLCDSVTTPFSTRSLRKRYVILPTSMLHSHEDLRIALGHELQHIRQRDTEWEIGLECLRPFFFWNPAFYLWKRQIEQLRELSCDQQVLARKAFSVEEYCNCLLRICENGLQKDKLVAGVMLKVAFVQLDHAPLSGKSADFLKHRLISLFESRTQRRPLASLLFFMLPLLGLVSLASVALQKPNDWSHDRLMFSTIINLERLAERNTTNTFAQPGN
ncbi:MAG: M56 family metallopeptidase [Cohaesibacter sp.]|jgi:hypothetical protein|nr:M56 family metallopeptidase [Cohaesibacter sp.]